LKTKNLQEKIRFEVEILNLRNFENGDLSTSQISVNKKKIEQYDYYFKGQIGEKFKKLIEWAANEVQINPGLLAVNLMAETSRTDYLTTNKVSSFIIGTDDFYDKRFELEKQILAYSKIFWDKKNITINTNENGRKVKSVFFQSGRHATLASAVYLKHGEIVLRQFATSINGNFDILPVETRFMLTRLAFNLGHNGANKELKLALKGRDILIRKPMKKAGPRRIATIRAIQAIHLSNTIFGINPK
jgi:hypothetical protein